jgi:hypothetical protein
LYFDARDELQRDDFAYLAKCSRRMASWQSRILSTKALEKLYAAMPPDAKVTAESVYHAIRQCRRYPTRAQCEAAAEKEGWARCTRKRWVCPECATKLSPAAPSPAQE